MHCTRVLNDRPTGKLVRGREGESRVKTREEAI